MSKPMYSLTNPQKSIWVTEEFYKGTPIENVAGTVDISQKVDFGALKKAINLFVKKNDSYRLKFMIKDDTVMQYVDDFSEFDVDIVPVESEKDVKALERSVCDTPFETLNNFLFNFKIYKFPNGYGGFVINAHHLITDAWTSGLVVDEIMNFYDALINNREISEELNPSYVEYINSENEYLNSEKFKKDKEFWNNLFETLPEPATIPSIKQENSKELDCSSKRKLFTIPKETISLINDFCRQKKASAFNFFMGVISLYLSRVSGLDEFVIGTPVLNRGNFKEKQTTGMFISIVPFKVSLNSDTLFGDFLSNISVDFLKIFRHQKYPYQYLLEDLRTKDNSIPNLFNVLISYQNARDNKQTFNIPYTSRWISNNNTSDDIDIHLYDMDDTGDISIAYDYLLSKYTIDDICSIHARILHIINQILENNEIKLKDIEIVTPDEKRKILYEFNDTKADYPKDKTIVQLFEEQVEKTPDNIAVVFGNEHLTYKELNERANSLAYYLKKQGLANEEIVCTFIDKSLEMIIAFLGILKAGGAYLPIDINYPKERIDYMIKNSSSRFLLVNDINFVSDNIKAISINLSNDIYNYNKNNLNLNFIDINNMAYIMYTSGSTGEPKGVIIEHKNIIRLVKNPNYINFSKNDRFLQGGSTVFDACTFEIWAPLLNGLQLYIIPKQDLLDPSSLQNYLEKNKITVLWITAPLFNQLSEKNPRIFSTVKYLLTGGDILSPQHINAVKKANPNLTVINGYGPTENTTFSTCFTIDKYYEDSIPIGYPISNSTCYIVSKDNNLLPIGVPGELLVGGDGVARGYLNDIALTNNKFIPNIYDEGHLYKTGDLVKWLPDGSISFIGRIDNQVKIRGFRVELNEITLKILEYPNIKNCLTVVNEFNNNKIIVSYIITEKNVDIDLLKEFLRKSLPSYMIPTSIITLESFPINTNGKVDRKKLPAPEIQLKNKEIVLPRNKTDENLINILKETLHLKDVSIDDSIFDLGGDSLTAINLCTKIYTALNVQLFVKDILENPIVKDLSDLIASKNNVNVKISIPKADKSEYYPTSSAQVRTYYSSNIAGYNSKLYNIAGGLILDKAPDIEKLENAFNKLIERQPSLRTYFEIENKQVVQKIKDDVEFKLETVSDIIKDNQLKSFFEDFVKPFDLSKAPLFMVKIVKLENGKILLAVNMHHIISDGTSLSVLVNDVCKIYNGEELPELKIDYKDYAIWENSRLKNNDFQEAENYWVNQFKNELPILNLPTKPRPAVQSFDGDKVYTEIDKESKEKIDRLAKDLSVTPYMILLSAYYILLSKYTSQNDIIVGTPIVNRPSSELYDIVGMFVNSLPIRANIDSKLNFKDFVSNIKDICFESYKYQNYPFDQLVNKLNLTRDTSRNPIFDTMFIYQNNGYTPVSFDGINAKYYIPNAKISKFDLSLEIVPTDDTLNLSFEYATKLFDKQFIENLSTHYINILNAVLENNDIKIADICMLSENEKNKILYEFNDTDVDYPKDKTIVQLFEEQVEKTPDNIAVVFGNEHLTYKELNERANSLARYLKNEGAQKENIIPVIMDRSINLIISMLGIIKLGAIYLPITTEFPTERVNYIIDNSSAPIIICSKSSAISKDNIKTIVLDEINYTDEPNSNLNTDIGANNPLYSIYTSGSTGNPKGVIISHKNLNNFISSFNRLFEVSKTTNVERCLASTNISFDVSIWEFFFTLLNGYELHLFEDNSITDIFKYCDAIISHKISMLYIPPNILDNVFKILEQKGEKVYLNKLLVGVESIKTKTIEKYYSFNPNIRIVNGYGPSECTICSTAYVVTKENLRNYSVLPIGKPLSNLKLYVLDKDKNPVPVGVGGELYVCGDNVGIGYINNDEMNQKNFVKLPYTTERAYRTGDMVKLDENGNLLFQGRQDNQVKINGHRIELDEITNTVHSYPYITKCVVYVDNKKIICYFTSDKKINQNDLLAYLKRKLPKYFIPNHLIQIDKFKLTSNGKIDMKYLKSLKIANKNKYVAPKTKLQKQLQEIFESVLGSTHIGINDDFFEIGGDSLSAIKLQIEAFNHGINISYKDIFSNPTIEQLSEKTGIGNIPTEETSGLDDNYDYSKIDKLISVNTLKSDNINLSKKKIESILLTGSTGFIGSHILQNLIENTNCNIYCIIRKKNNIDPVNRLIDTMNFYFNNNFEKYLYDRVFVLEGDISKTNLGLDSNSYKDLGYSVSDVINAAAIVKHYGKSNIFNDINVVGTQNLITFCNKFKCSLHHISTLSVSGTLLDSDLDTLPENLLSTTFLENNLFINQDLSNIYVRSKFLAERLILENIVENDLDANIFRLGNITNRYSDGNFQINISENAFINKVFAFLNIGKFPNNLLDEIVEFTPVDLCADIILKIIFCKCDFNIFHIHNNNYISFKDLISIFEELGFKTNIVSPEEFYDLVKTISADKNKNNIISGIINDFNISNLISYKNDIKMLSPLTDAILKKLSFKWPTVDKKYIQKYVTYLKSIGYI